MTKNPKHPLAEVFGFPVDNLTEEAVRYRNNRLCPYNNKVPSCTKDKAKAPLGVCSVFEQGGMAITCPIRFREGWLIVEDAAGFFFQGDTDWTTLQEVRLADKNGQSAGNIDLVLVSYDDEGRVKDFGSLEVQAVYISGNVRLPFEHYMKDPAARKEMEWKDTSVRPDYLSSSRKRLVPQMIYKGGILKSWGKKQAVALHRGFYDTLPRLPVVEKDEADIAWFVYDTTLDSSTNRYRLAKTDTIYTRFEPALKKITTPLPGPLDAFVSILQGKLDEQLESENPPDVEEKKDKLII